MNKKLSSQVSESIKHISEEVPAELFELSEEDLQKIVGGLPLWKAIKSAAQDKNNAVKTTFHDLFTQGKFPTGQTANDLLEPPEWSIFRRLFW